MGEIRRGAERLRLRDPAQVVPLDRWLERLSLQYSDRIHPIDESVALRWGMLGIRQPISVADGLIGATALAHHLVLVTRNTSDFEPHRIPVLNPFSGVSGMTTSTPRRDAVAGIPPACEGNRIRSLSLAVGRALFAAQFK